MDDRNVIHLTRGQSRNGFSSSPSHPSDGPVERSTLEEFLSGGELYRYEYGVNAFFFLFKLWGTCTRASSDPPEDVLYRATFLCKHGFGDYDLSDNNCEDFALYCKTELRDLRGSSKIGTSGQMACLVAVITAIFARIILSYEFLPTSFVGLVAKLFCFYCTSRLYFDAGSRNYDGLKKVPVYQIPKQSSSDSVVWREIDAKLVVIVTIVVLIIWYWTPKDPIEMAAKAILLNYSALSVPFSYCLKNHHLKIRDAYMYLQQYIGTRGLSI
ncbi:hypothetical protein FNV43_RR15005 [Rhamnella rubrinervis]|uniref:LRAT domain-containing protein n=1 Tax=Rhamnella rubrinervis TaxID=2594499 RepID=A0A8K0E125_9ROSA|nr:hypothetical protein FNV43_RR15005 [Rhamnella rubrinervis]